MTTLRDQYARDRIRKDFGATLVVEAAAGTGKTTELVARIVELVRSGRAALDRILAVTFTDLAAGEMKLRLRAELENARGGANPEEQDRLTAALRKLEVAPIGTIHSFCADLLREWPVEARVDPVFEVAAGETQARLYDQAFDAWFQRILSDPPEGVRRLLRRRPRHSGDETPRERLHDAGFDLCEHRDFAASWARPSFDRHGGLVRALEKLAEVSALAARAQKPDDKLVVALADVQRFVADVRRREDARGPDDDALEAELHELSRRWIWRSNGYGKWFCQGLLRTEVQRLRDEAKAALDEALSDCDADLAGALRDELRPLCDEYEGLKARAGALDFLDLLLRARDLVRGDRSVRGELQDRFTHVLVDEFQDTDPLQAEILVLLAADDPARDDWRKARPVPGKLFLVGDPKQSIYRFRRADIALYEEVKSVLVARGAEVLHLTSSFRAVPQIQQAINAGFAPAMQGGTQAAYVPLDGVRPDLAGQPALIALPAPELYSEWGRIVNKRIEASYPDAVGAFVDWLLTRSGWTVSERDKAQPVPVEARHVCFLFKRYRGFREDLTRPYVRALEARRIAHVLVGGRSYHAREEVLAVRNAATAVEWPEDELSVFAALKGPLFAVGDEALLLFRERQGRLHPLRRLDLETLEGPERDVAQALAVLGELHLHRNRRPIAHTLTRLLEATRAHAGIAIWPNGEQALANVLRVLELARRFEAAGASSFRAFVEHLAAEALRGDAAEAPVVEEGTDGVRIMSVHRAKGLEFPVVVLCDPCAPGAPQRPSRHVDPERGLWAMPLAGCIPLDLSQRAAEVLARDREEAVRVAYVAATRARDLLVVPAQGDGEPEGWLAPLNPAISPEPSERRTPRAAPGCPAFGKETVLDRPENALAPLSVSPGLHRPRAGTHEVVWWDPHALELGKEPEGGLRSNDLLVEHASPAAAEAARTHDAWRVSRAGALAAGARPAMEVTTATARSLAGAPAAPAEMVRVERRDPARPRGKRFGALVHSLLERIDLDGGPEAIARAAEVQGRAVGAAPSEVEAARAAVEAALRHPLLRAAAQSRDCRREVAVQHVLPDGMLVEGIVDLAFRGPEGWTVVDFKTDARAEDHPQYAGQLALYCDAVRAATGEPARGVLLGV